MNRVYLEKSGVPTGTYYMVGLFLFPLLVIFLWGIYQQVILGEPFGNNPAGNSILILISTGVFALSVAIFWILSIIKTEIRVADRQISFRFPPFINKTRCYSFDDIEAWAIEKKNPFKTGIGLRIDPINSAKIYSSGTRYVIRLKLNTGKSLMLSTKYPEDLRRAIESTENENHV